MKWIKKNKKYAVALVVAVGAGLTFLELKIPDWLHDVLVALGLTGNGAN